MASQLGTSELKRLTPFPAPCSMSTGSRPVQMRALFQRQFLTRYSREIPSAKIKKFEEIVLVHLVISSRGVAAILPSQKMVSGKAELAAKWKIEWTLNIKPAVHGPYDNILWLLFLFINTFFIYWRNKLIYKLLACFFVCKILVSTVRVLFTGQMGALCDNRQSQNISWLLSGHEKALHMCKIRIWVQIMRVMNMMVIWIL